MKYSTIVSKSLVAAGVFLATDVASPAIAQSQTKQMTETLAELCRKYDVPAMTVAVVNAKGLVKAECFGDRRRGTADKVQLSDRFPIGSNTKSMTATLAAVLMEAGKIEWNTTIGDVWPEASNREIHPKLRTVTLDQLLSHQSGLPANISDISAQAWAGFFEEKQSPMLERKRMIKLVLSKAPSQTQGKFAYSNLGYAVASAMLETRGGDSFESLMKKHVFAPLKMRSADFRSMKSAKRLRPPMLWGHQASNGQPVDPQNVASENPTVYAAAGTVHVSIEDYAKYAIWHLAGKPAPLLKTQDAFDILHEPVVDYTGGDKYGRGWVCSDTDLGRALSHAGSNTNTFAVITVIPESDFAAVICANSGQSKAFAACNEMTRHLKAHLTATNRGAAKVTPDRLVGKYELIPSFVFDVSLKDGHLLVGITNQPTQEVFADSPTLWSYRGVDAQLEFHLRQKGPAYALTLHQNGAAQKAKRVRE